MRLDPKAEARHKSKKTKVKKRKCSKKGQVAPSGRHQWLNLRVGIVVDLQRLDLELRAYCGNAHAIDLNQAMCQVWEAHLQTPAKDPARPVMACDYHDRSVCNYLFADNIGVHCKSNKVIPLLDIHL